MNELRKSLLLNKNNMKGESLFSDISPNNVLNNFWNFSRMQSPQNLNDENNKK